MSKEEVSKLISLKLEEAFKLMQECEQLADKYSVDFELPWGGEGDMRKGLGGYYCPEGDTKGSWRFEEYYGYGQNGAGWIPSAGSC